MNNQTNNSGEILNTINAFGLIGRVISFVLWRLVEEYERNGWWILNEQEGYAGDWTTGGVFMARLVPNLN